MEKLNFYSEKKSELFLKSTFKSICFLGACTAHNLASGIEYFSNYNITTYAPYQTIFNAPSLLKDLEIVSHSLKHKVIIDSQLKLFTDEIRFWNTSNNVNEVIEKNKINFQQDKRHPSVELIADVSKHIVREIDKSLLSKTPSERFSINKVNTRGKIYGKDYL